MAHKIAILGAGNIGKAKAAYLASIGNSVNLYNRSINRLTSLLIDKTITFSGVISGEGVLNRVSIDLQDTINDTDIILMTMPALYHLDVADKIAPFLNENQIILLFSGKFGGSILVESAIKKINPLFNGVVIEATSVFSSRELEHNQIWIRGIKQKVRFASTNSMETIKVTPLIKELFNTLTPTNNYLKRSFCDIGAILHVPIFLFNLTRIEKAEEFFFYKDGVTPKIAEIIQVLDEERQIIAKAYGLEVPSLVDIIKEYYNTSGFNLFEVIHNTKSYMISKAPQSLDHRYIKEELSESLVPMYKMGVAKGLISPMMRSFIDASSVIYQYPFIEKGRDLTNIYKKGLSCV